MINYINPELTKIALQTKYAVNYNQGQPVFYNIQIENTALNGDYAFLHTANFGTFNVWVGIFVVNINFSIAGNVSYTLVTPVVTGIPFVNQNQKIVTNVATATSANNMNAPFQEPTIFNQFTLANTACSGTFNFFGFLFTQQ